MNQLAILPVLIPLCAGAALLVAGGQSIRVQRIVSLGATAAGLAVAILLLARAAGGEVDVYYLGDWPAPFGIVLVVDRLSAMMLTLAGLLALASLCYAVAGEDRAGQHFHVLFQMQLLGINGAFLTGDLFNLFVFFEILLIASYALQLFGGGAPRVRAALHVVVLNLVGSSIFLIGIGAIYAATGTLNLADLALRVAAATPEQAGLLRAGGLLLLVVFGLKAALVPLGFWLPPAYSAATGSVACLFAIMTKVGFYAILRVHGLVFGPDGGVAASLAAPWLLPLGLATITGATLGVLASRDLQRLFAYLVVASAGTLVLALGLETEAGRSAALYYALNSTLVAGGLFLLADLIAKARGAARADFAAPEALDQRALLGSLFFIGAVGVAGLPPLAGFAAKVYILQSALAHRSATWVFLVVLLSGLLVIVALSRAGSAIFWRPSAAPVGQQHRSLLRASATGVLLLASALLIGLAAPLTEYTRVTASQLAHRETYVSAVMANVGVTPRAGATEGF